MSGRVIYNVRKLEAAEIAASKLPTFLRWAIVQAHKPAAIVRRFRTRREAWQTLLEWSGAIEKTGAKSKGRAYPPPI